MTNPRFPLPVRSDGWHSDQEMLAAKYGLWRTDQDWTGRPPVKVPLWTIAYRTGDEPVFHRVSEWQGTWQQAHDFAGEFATMHPDVDQVYYTTTREAELIDYVGREDILNLMLDDGTRIPVADDGTL
jgi:hypothetical protein